MADPPILRNRREDIHPQFFVPDVGGTATRPSPAPEPGISLSASLVEDLTIHRTAALSAVLKDKPEVALAALTEALAAQVFYHGYGHNSPVKISLAEANLRSAEGSKVYDALAKTDERCAANRVHVLANSRD